MDQFRIRFHKIDPEKIPVCFTFDDNFSRHHKLIAPAFLQRGFRCTFYVNPGTNDFAPHLENYKALLELGFEIGSHGDVHDNLSKLEPAAALKNMRCAARRIQECFGVYPSTFAFPYHDYNEETLRMARSFHIETRNTLTDSVWFAIKMAIPLSEMLTTVERCIEEKRPLIFSGHSVILTQNEVNDERLKTETGSNPILLDDLCALLDFIASKGESVQVLTFEQAAVLAYLRQHGDVTGNAFTISQEHLGYLVAFGIGTERLCRLI